MKIAATIIDGKCVDCGENLQEQKSAVKALVGKYGAGDDKVYVLYSSQRPAVRKRIKLPKDVDADKLYAEGVSLAKKEDDARKKAAKAAQKQLEEERKSARARQRARRDAATKGHRTRAEKAKAKAAEATSEEK